MISDVFDALMDLLVFFADISPSDVVVDIAATSIDGLRMIRLTL